MAGVPTPRLNIRNAKAPGSPFFASAHIKIGDWDFTPIPPRHLIEFSYEDTMAIGADRMVARFFEPNSLDILEDAILNGVNDVEVSFGYMDGGPGGGELMTPIINMRLVDYHPVFTGIGVDITIEAHDLSFDTNMVAHSFTYGPKEVTPTDPNNKNPTISDIVKFIAIRNGFTIIDANGKETVEDTWPVPGPYGLDVDDVPKIYHQIEKSDLQFIVQDLQPYAISLKETKGDPRDMSLIGRGHYTLYFVDRGPGNNPELHFHPPRFDSPITKRYTYGRSRHSTVLEFKPEIRGAAFLALGSGRVSGTAFDSLNKAVYNAVASNKTNPIKYRTGPVTIGPITYLSSPDDPFWMVKRAIPLPHPSWIEVNFATRGRWEPFFNMILGGTMTIIGDPTIKPNDQISIEAYGYKQRNGFVEPHLHYSSGSYLVLSSVHRIQNGEYTTTLELLKNSFENPKAGNEEALGTLVQPGVPNDWQGPLPPDPEGTPP